MCCCDNTGCLITEIKTCSSSSGTCCKYRPRRLRKTHDYNLVGAASLAAFHVCLYVCAVSVCASGSLYEWQRRWEACDETLMSPGGLAKPPWRETRHKSMSVTSGGLRKGLFSQGQLSQGQPKFQIWVLLMTLLSNSWDQDPRERPEIIFTASFTTEQINGWIQIKHDCLFLIESC